MRGRRNAHLSREAIWSFMWHHATRRLPVRRRNSETITEEGRGPRMGRRIGGRGRQARGSRSIHGVCLLVPERASARPSVASHPETTESSTEARVVDAVAVAPQVTWRRVADSFDVAPQVTWRRVADSFDHALRHPCARRVRGDTRRGKSCGCAEPSSRSPRGAQSPSPSSKGRMTWARPSSFLPTKERSPS